jgi:hypothetical protein
MFSSSVAEGVRRGVCGSAGIEVSVDVFGSSRYAVVAGSSRYGSYAGAWWGSGGSGFMIDELFEEDVDGEELWGEVGESW